MPGDTPTIITIIIAITGLLGYTVKKVMNYFMSQNKTLVSQNQENVKSFTETINHQRSKDREALNVISGHVKDIGNHIKNTDETNKQLINFLKNGK